MFRLVKFRASPRLLGGLRYNSTSAVSPSIAEFRIAKVIKVDNHPNADRLYVSQMQVRTVTEDDSGLVQVCSGLVGLVPRETLAASRVVLVMNLKPSKMRGVQSEAMLLAADKPIDDGYEVELVQPPEGQVGQRVWFQGHDGEPLKRVKKSKWDEIAKNLHTNSKGEVCFKESSLGYEDAAGQWHPCKVDNLIDCSVH